VPTTPTPQIAATRWTALVEGRLVRVDGCYRIEEMEPGTGYTLVWPPEFEVAAAGDTMRIVGGFGKGETWEFHAGDRVSLAGGELQSITDPDERRQLRVPEGCPGPFWVFGGGKRVE
jgi:hypothetical protein